MPSAMASSANRVCSHGSTASAVPVANSVRSDASRPAIIVVTPAITIAAPSPSGKATNDWKKNGTESATDAQPNQLAAMSWVTLHAAVHASAVAQPQTSARNTTTPG